jgi:hypothetical protein
LMHKVIMVIWGQLSLLLQEALKVFTIKVEVWKKSNIEEKHLATETTTSCNWCAKQCMQKAYGFSSNIYLCKPWNPPFIFDALSYPCPRILHIDNPWEAHIQSKVNFSDDDVVSTTSLKPRNFSITSPLAFTYLHRERNMINTHV